MNIDAGKFEGKLEWVEMLPPEPPLFSHHRLLAWDKCVGEIWEHSNHSIWHTWDSGEVGGENGVEYVKSLGDIKIKVEESLKRQGWDKPIIDGRQESGVWRGL